MALGAGLLALGLLYHGSAAFYALTGGVGGILLGSLYLVSPAWKVEVLVHEHGLEVLSRGDRRFLLSWDEVVTVVASPSTRTCFVDGGHPDRSLLVPGPGASAPYDIEDKAALYEAIVERVPAERVTLVETLETARLPGASDEGASDEALDDESGGAPDHASSDASSKEGFGAGSGAGSDDAPGGQEDSSEPVQSTSKQLESTSQ